MSSEQGNRRRVCRKSYSIDPPSPAALRTSKTMFDTSRHVRLLTDARHTADKLPRTELFKIHNVSKVTGYRIIKEETIRHNEKVHNRDRKRILVLYKCKVIETIKDINFNFTFFSYFKIVKIININNDFERII